MSTWLGHLLLHSVGLALTALAIWASRPWWRRDPLRSYRLLSAFTLLMILVPALQVGLQGSGTLAGGTVIPWPKVRAWVAERLSSPVPRPGLDAPHGAARSREPAAPASGSTAAGLAQPGAPESSPATDPASARSELTGSPAAAAPSLLEIALAIYLAGLAASAIWSALRLLRTLRLVRGARPVTDRDTLELFDRIRKRCPLRRRVRLLSSPELTSPACWGLQSAVVLLPETGRPTREALRWALTHELVHLERRDAWGALVETMLTMVLWFHPAAWWLARELHCLREMSCDARVVQLTGRRRRYASALLDYAGAAATRRSSTCPTLLHWSRSRTQLRRRIEMLVSRKLPGRPLRGGIALAWIGLVATAVWSTQVAASAALFPSRAAAPATPALFDPATVTEEPRLGLAVARPGPALAAQLGRDADQALVITEVVPGSPADHAGLQQWDAIVAVGDRPASFEALVAARAQNIVRLQVVRRGEALWFEVVPRHTGRDPRLPAPLPRAVGGLPSAAPTLPARAVAGATPAAPTRPAPAAEVARPAAPALPARSAPAATPERSGFPAQAAAPALPTSAPPVIHDVRPQVTYEVRTGDTLGLIARKNLGTASRWQEIMEANSGLDPRRLRPGQKIRIPRPAPPARDPVAAAESAAESARMAERFYALAREGMALPADRRQAAALQEYAEVAPVLDREALDTLRSARFFWEDALASPYAQTDPSGATPATAPSASSSLRYARAEATVPSYTQLREYHSTARLPEPLPVPDAGQAYEPYRKAIDAFERALRLEPERSDYRQALQFLLRQRKAEQPDTAPESARRRIY